MSGTYFPLDPNVREKVSVRDSYLSTVELLPGGPVRGSIRPPGSKSLTNRALLCAAFADGQSHLSGALRSDDTEVMTAALRELRVGLDESISGRSLEVTGIGSGASNGVEPPSAARPERKLFIGNSGTTIRFLTAALSAFGGDYWLYGVERMHRRPIGDLVDALAPVCDGTVVCENPGGCPPVRIRTKGWSGDRLRVAGNVSSQYLSGLMMAAPIAEKRVEIEVTGELVSRPYVEMTARLMSDFGVDCQWAGECGDDLGDRPIVCRIDGRSGYRATEYAIEPDASAASYFWAAAAISGGEVTVSGLSANALQGDVRFVDCLEQMGCRVTRGVDQITVAGADGDHPRLRGIDIDMNAISDTVQTLSVVALFADGPTVIRGVAHNRFKETDRIGDLARELRKLGAEVFETADGLVITPGELVGATLDTYDDHRMAMSLALAGLKVPGVRIKDPACTAKTYPDFFADMESLLGRPHRWESVRG